MHFLLNKFVGLWIWWLSNDRKFFVWCVVTLVINADIDRCKYSGYVIGLDRRGTFSLVNGFGRNVISFGVDMSSSVYVDSKKKDILILGEGPTEGLYDIRLTAEKKHSISFTEINKKLYKYSGYGIGFDRRGTFSVANGFGRNIIIFE